MRKHASIGTGSNGIGSNGMGEAAGQLRRLGIYPILLGLLAVFLFVQIIRLAWLVITPLGPVGNWNANEAQILSPQSRLSLFSSFDPFFRNGVAANDTAITSLQMTLYGVRTNSGSGLGSAILAGPDGVQESYAVGDEIMSGVSLDSVRFDHVTINRNGVRESLYLDQSVPAEIVGDDEIIETTGAGQIPAITDSMTAGAASAIADIARFEPRTNDGKITGIAVSANGASDVFRSAGFRNGDVITQVNGRAISSAADIDALKSQIALGASLSIQLERGTEKAPVSIKLDGL